MIKYRALWKSAPSDSCPGWSLQIVRVELMSASGSSTFNEHLVMGPRDESSCLAVLAICPYQQVSANLQQYIQIMAWPSPAHPHSRPPLFRTLSATSQIFTRFLRPHRGIWITRHPSLGPYRRGHPSRRTSIAKDIQTLYQGVE